MKNPVIALNASPTRSDRYAFVNTAQILDTLASKNWTVSSTSVKKVRNTEKEGFQKHVLRLRNDRMPQVSGSVPELVLVNSHDGTSALQLHAGFFRVACANGLIVGTQFESIKVVHSDRFVKNLDSAIEEFAARMPATVQTVDTWSKIILTKSQKEELIVNSLSLRLNENESIFRIPSVYRLDDTSDDLFTVYNRAQEAVIRGRFQTIKTDEEGRRSLHKKRLISSVDQDIKLNKQLWDLAAKFAA